MMEHSECFLTANLDTIRKFIRALILALSDGLPNNKFTDQNSSENSIINEDFGKLVFSRCGYDIINNFQNQIPGIISENSEYKKYKYAMAWIILELNESNCLDKRTADYLMKFCNITPKCSTLIQRYPNKSDVNGHMCVLNTLQSQIWLHEFSFPLLLRWLMLIYELQFMYGDLNSKLDNLYYIYNYGI
ncbi:hypothetical protein RF11_14971 [Thelohanellus kitauei]|uniref:Uncharacterized protein n=1 Tax=Thelohanellus kitauei TaxID=669202 RepID=A0A0C2II47_THEKT|nr:hypothetical protein RF11_14971 [Thelohanellus kitauei]